MAPTTILNFNNGSTLQRIYVLYSTTLQRISPIRQIHCQLTAYSISASFTDVQLPHYSNLNCTDSLRLLIVIVLQYQNCSPTKYLC